MILRDQSAEVDWLLTDIRLPGVIGGWVVGSEFALKASVATVIYMSGVEEDAASRRAASSIFLPKPVDVNVLVSAFRGLSVAPL